MILMAWGRGWMIVALDVQGEREAKTSGGGGPDSMPALRFS